MHTAIFLLRTEPNQPETVGIFPTVNFTFIRMLCALCSVCSLTSQDVYRCYDCPACPQFHHRADRTCRILLIVLIPRLSIFCSTWSSVCAQREGTQEHLAPAPSSAPTRALYSSNMYQIRQSSFSGGQVCSRSCCFAFLVLEPGEVSLQTIASFSGSFTAEI